MLSRMRRVTSWAAAGAPTLVILALLAGLYLWGVRHDWKIGPLSGLWGGAEAAEKDESLPTVKVVKEASAKDSEPVMRIEFPSAADVKQAGIHVAPVETHSMARYVTAYGSVDYDPGYYAELASRANGSVWRVEAEIGQHMRKGEPLALIESAEVGKTKADFLQSLTQVEARQQTVKRLESAGGSVAEANRIDAEANLREARIRLFNDHQRLLNLGLVVNLKDLDGLGERDRVRRLRLLGLPESVRRDFDPETLTANLLPLTMPFEGLVVNRKAAPGEVVNTAQILFTVADLRHLHIDLDVHPEDMVHVEPRLIVTFEPDKKEIPPVQAVISHISPEVNEKTRVVEVHAEADNPQGQLRPHTFGTGRILLEERPNAVVVPTEAVQSDGPNSLVFVRRSDTVFVSRLVKPGLRSEGYTEVEGVQPGEEVATTGSHLLKSELLKDRIGVVED